MRNRILLFSSILLIGFAATGFYLYFKPRTGIENKASLLTIDAGVLYNDYEQNEAAADKRYANAVITVKGKVTDVQRSDSSMSITLNAGKGGGVNCSFASVGKEIVTPVVGGNVIVKGRCTGFLMDVNLVDCIFLAPGNEP